MIQVVASSSNWADVIRSSVSGCNGTDSVLERRSSEDLRSANVTEFPVEVRRRDGLRMEEVAEVGRGGEVTVLDLVEEGWSGGDCLGGVPPGGGGGGGGGGCGVIVGCE